MMCHMMYSFRSLEEAAEHYKMLRDEYTRKFNMLSDMGFGNPGFMLDDLRRRLTELGIQLEENGIDVKMYHDKDKTLHNKSEER